MSSRLCLGGCGTEVSGRRKRCPECRRLDRVRRERERYHNSRGQDIADSDHMDAPVVDYTVTTARPPSPDTPARPYRPHWTHDNATRIRVLETMNAADDELLTPDQSTWDELANREPDTRILFPAAQGSPAADGSPFRRGREAREVTNHAANGTLWRSAPGTSGPGRGHLVDRWGRPR